MSSLHRVGVGLVLALALSWPAAPGQTFAEGHRAEREVAWAASLDEAFARAQEVGKPVLMVMSVNFLGNPKVEKC